MRNSFAALAGAISALFGTAAGATVVVVGNYKTGEVIIQGNQGGAEADRVAALAKGGTDAGWTMIYSPDDDVRGWGMVQCVRHSTGVFFAEAIGETSEAEAQRTIDLKVNRFLARLVGGDDAALIEKSATWPGLARQAIESGIAARVDCAPAWNDQGQPIDYVGKPIGASGAEPKAPKPDEAANSAPAKPDSPADRKKTAVAEEASAPSAPKRDYDAEYREKMRAYEAQLAENARQVARFEAEKARLEEQRIASAERARQAEEAHQRDLAEHEAQVAAVEETNRRRQADYQRQLEQWRTGPSDAVIDFPEAVSVCGLDQSDPQSQFGNWKCVGPLQFDYAKLGAGGESEAAPLGGVANSCGTKVDSLRDLGMVNGYRVFGCAFGINPDPGKRTSNDSAKQFGLDYIGGRMVFHCRASESSCRTR
jgi:hypothetical protein